MDPSNLLPVEVLRPDSDPLLDFEADLEAAARALDLEPWVVQRLKHAEREITVNVPLVRDGGSAINLTGHRVQHSRAQGPCIGPLELLPGAHLAALRVRATEITLQSALLGLRFGGAAGALVVDPEQVSERELRHAVRDFVAALHENTGPLSDILAAEGNEYVTAWMEKANTQARGQCEPAAIVGKHVPGCDLDEAWGRAIAALIQDAVQAERLEGRRITLQGFGRRGCALARALDSQGARVVGVADRSGGLVSDPGLDLAALIEHVARNGVVFGFPGAEAASNADLLECYCDVLVLAAAERQVGEHNAPRIRARMVLELTPDGVTREGELALPERCMLIPHLLAGGARLAIWSHEWQRGLSFAAPDPQHAEVEATSFVLHAFDRARQMSAKDGLSLRGAALRLALSRLAATLRLK